MPFPSASESPVGRPALVATTLGLLALLVFLPTVRGSFVDWDDDRYVSENSLVLEGLTGSGIRRAFTDVVFHNWAPLTILSYQLDASVYGRHPWGFHLTNAIIHAMSAGLLYLVLVRMTSAPERSMSAAALWAVHPLRVESVAWIAERKDVLSVFFLMLALLAYERYCRRPDGGRYLAVFMAMLGSLLCKSTLVTLPLLLLLLDVWPLGRLSVPWIGRPSRSDGAASPYPVRSWQRVLGEKVPLVGLSLIFSRITFVTQADALASPLVMSFQRARVPNAISSLTWYLQKTLVPTGLHPACHHLGHDVSWPVVFVSLTVVLASLVLAIVLGRRCPYLPWGLGWFLAAILPVIGLVQTGFQSHADRFTYIPHIGLAVAAVWASCDLAIRWALPPSALKAAFVGVSLVGVALTERQIAVWSTADTLWTHVLSVEPDNAVALSKKANGLARAGRGDEAEKLYLRSLERVEYPWVIAALARLYHTRGDMARMERYRDWAARVAPDDETVVGMLRDLPAAGKSSTRQKADPRVVRLLEQGSVALNAGRFADALAAFESAIEADPTFAPARNLAGITCAGLDRQPEAAAHFRAAIELDGDNFGYRVNLARVLSVLQDWPGCLAACREAMAKNPEDPELRTLLDRAQRKVSAR